MEIEYVTDEHGRIRTQEVHAGVMRDFMKENIAEVFFDVSILLLLALLVTTLIVTVAVM